MQKKRNVKICVNIHQKLLQNSTFNQDGINDIRQFVQITVNQNKFSHTLKVHRMSHTRPSITDYLLQRMLQPTALLPTG